MESHEIVISLHERLSDLQETSNFNLLRYRGDALTHGDGCCLLLRLTIFIQRRIMPRAGRVEKMRFWGFLHQCCPCHARTSGNGAFDCVPCFEDWFLLQNREVEFWSNKFHAAIAIMREIKSQTPQGTGWAITFNLNSAIQEWFGGSGGVQSELSRWVAGAKVLPTADAAEVKVPQGLPSKSSTCSKTATLRTLVFYSLDFTVSSLYIDIYILYIYLFIYLFIFFLILFILLSIDFSPCLIFFIDVYWCHWCCVTVWYEVGTTLRYPFTTFFRLTASPSAACACEAPLMQERADDTEAWGGGRMVEFFAQSCPHCKHLEPIWKDASHKWAEQGQERENVVRINENECGFFIGKMTLWKKNRENSGRIYENSWTMVRDGNMIWNQLDANGPEDSVRWEQKECYGENWSEGKDHDECMKEGIHSFPTVRFFSNLACRYSKKAISAKKCAVLSIVNM